MNWVDLVIILLVISSAVNGVYRGAAVQLLSFGGFWGGLLLGAFLAPAIADLFGGSGAKAVVSLVTVFGMASLLGAVGQAAGVRIWGRLQRSRLRVADAAGGGAVAVAATLLAVWLIAVMLAAVPLRSLSQGIQQSGAVGFLTRTLPPAPSVFAQLRNLFSTAGFPQVFAELEPDPGPGVATPADPEVGGAVQAAGVSTVKVTGVGCGGIQTGSGFVVSPELVITNAHVIAGIDDPVVEDDAGRHRATPVVFDPDLDVAVLRVGGLAGPPLNLLAGSIPRGGGTAVLGFPGGGPFSANPAAVRDEFNAQGRDIYGRRIVTRRVYQLQAQVRSGNSGGPFVESDGDVGGLVFSRSAFRENIGYSIKSTEVTGHVGQARGRSQPTDTGPCLN